MTLDQLQTREKGTIIKVRGRGAFRKRILEMGFVTGQQIEVVKNAPFKDPVEYKIMGYNISLRRNEARFIDVMAMEGSEACFDPHETDRDSKKTRTWKKDHPLSPGSNLTLTVP